jgi:hypothetical protein
MKKKAPKKLPPRRYVVDTPLEPKFPTITFSLVDHTATEKVGKELIVLGTDTEIRINGSLLAKLTWDGHLSLAHMDDNLKMLGYKWDEQGYVKLRKEKP